MMAGVQVGQIRVSGTALGALLGSNRVKCKGYAGVRQEDLMVSSGLKLYELLINGDGW